MCNIGYGLSCYSVNYIKYT